MSVGFANVVLSFSSKPTCSLTIASIFLLAFVQFQVKYHQSSVMTSLSSGVFISFARLSGPGLLRIMLDSFRFLETFGLSVVHLRTLSFPALDLKIFLSCGTTGS